MSPEEELARIRARMDSGEIRIPEDYGPSWEEAMRGPDLPPYIDLKEVVK